MKLNIKYMFAAFMLAVIRILKNLKQREERVLLPWNSPQSCRRLCRDRLN